MLRVGGGALGEHPPSFNYGVTRAALQGGVAVEKVVAVGGGMVTAEPTDFGGEGLEPGGKWGIAAFGGEGVHIEELVVLHFVEVPSFWTVCAHALFMSAAGAEHRHGGRQCELAGEEAGKPPGLQFEKGEGDNGVGEAEKGEARVMRRDQLPVERVDPVVLDAHNAGGEEGEMIMVAGAEEKGIEIFDTGAVREPDSVGGKAFRCGAGDNVGREVEVRWVFGKPEDGVGNAGKLDGEVEGGGGSAEKSDPLVCERFGNAVIMAMEEEAGKVVHAGEGGNPSLRKVSICHDDGVKLLGLAGLDFEGPALSVERTDLGDGGVVADMGVQVEVTGKVLEVATDFGMVEKLRLGSGTREREIPERHKILGQIGPERTVERGMALSGRVATERVVLGFRVVDPNAPAHPGFFENADLQALPQGLAGGNESGGAGTDDPEAFLFGVGHDEKLGREVMKCKRKATLPGCPAH